MVSQAPPVRQANGRSRTECRDGAAVQQRERRQSTFEPKLLDNSAAAMKLIGIAMLTEINGDVKNCNLAFQLVQHDDLSDPDLGEIWRTLKQIYSRSLPLTPDRGGSGRRRSGNGFHLANLRNPLFRLGIGPSRRCAGGNLVYSPLPKVTRRQGSRYNRPPRSAHLRIIGPKETPLTYI